MQHSDKPYIELNLAKQAILAMRAAQSLPELEGAWHTFLYRLDRIWNKAEAHFCRSPKWAGWHGQYKAARRNDQLLVYLVQARNVDEHTISEITERSPGRLSINPLDDGGTLLINKLVINNGQIVEFEPGSPARIDFHPAYVRLLPVESRGVTYPVPRLHLGQPIDCDDLVRVAELAVAFYEGFLERAERFFVG